MNVLVIMVDDMRYDLLPFMPYVNGTLRAGGTLFTNARANVPICQAARIGFLTGQYARGANNGVYQNDDGIGAADTENIGIYLQAAGVETAFVGKCPNTYRQATPRAGWDAWHPIVTNEQQPYGYTVADGAGGSDSPTEHEVLGLVPYVTDFIDAATEPWFVWYTPTQPHIHSVNFNNNPLPEDQDKFTWLNWSIDEMTDSSSRPTWLQSRTELTDVEKSRVKQSARQQVRELLGLDRSIQTIVQHIGSLGQLEDTLVIFVSDNGVFLGEHNATNNAGGGKDEPYDPAVRVPLICYGGPFAAGAVNATPTVPYQDIHATLLDIFDARGSAPDGRSLRADPDPTRATLYERSANDQGYPDAQGVFAANRTLVRYVEGTGTPATDFTANPDDEYEMFYNDDDPSQYTNRANLGGADLAERDRLEALLDDLLL